MTWPQSTKRRASQAGHRATDPRRPRLSVGLSSAALPGEKSSRQGESVTDGICCQDEDGFEEEPVEEERVAIRNFDGLLGGRRSRIEMEVKNVYPR